MDTEKASALLQSAQSLRIQWSNDITKHFGYAIILNSALWSYILVSFIDKSDNLYYLVLGSGISSVLLGGWRLYSHRIDEGITNLYPDLIRWEYELGSPLNLGTRLYLVSTNDIFDEIFLSKELTPEQHSDAIFYLTNRRKIGDRGARKLDRFVATMIFFFVMVSGFYVSYKLNSYSVTTAELIIISFSMYFLMHGAFFSRFALVYQENPNSDDIKAAIKYAVNSDDK